MQVFRLDGFTSERGFAFTAPTPDDARATADGTRFFLIEDGKMLGPAESPHDAIRKAGRGAFSVWGPDVYLSASDNTDPNENGRQYLLIAEDIGGESQTGSLLSGFLAAGKPENLKPRDLSAVDAAADYAIACGRSYLNQAKRLGCQLAGARVLEIGPGTDFGAALILASHGADVAVADRFVAPWDVPYHSALYRRMLERWDGPNAALRQAADGLCPLTIIHRSSEEMADVSGLAGAFNLVLSMAVLEHVSDVRASCRSLAAVTAPGGFNVHQVDFRDHDSFDRPLEFLCEADDTFAEKFVARLAETGNRKRPSELVEFFREAGLDLVEPPYPTERASDDYLAEFLPRLRASPSRYAQWPAEDLKVTSALCITRRRE
jgi:hypothetical protein